jgi:alpha-galactosidase
MLKGISVKAYQLLAVLLVVSMVSCTGFCNAQDTSNLFHVELNKTDGSYSIIGTDSVGVVFRARVAAKIDGRWWRSTDYPKHDVVESEISDNLGVARQIIVTHSGIEGAPNLLCVLKIHPETSSGDVEVRVENHQSKAVLVQAIRPIEAFGTRILELGGPYDLDRVLSDSLSEDRPELRVHDLLDKMPAEMHRAVGSQLIYNRKSGLSLFVGALNADRFLTILRLHVDRNSMDEKISAFEVDSTGTTEMLNENSLEGSSIEDQIDLSVPLQPEQSVSSERLLFSVSSDYHAQLETYGELIRKLHHARIPSFTPMGWWSWTAYYFGLNEAAALTNARWLSEHLKPLGYSFFHIDEGYQYARGEYISPDAGLFPDGMRILESKIRGLGLTPGIWTAPFEVSERSSIYLNHKDWLVHNAKGEPIHLGWVSDRKDRLYALDTTNPGAQEYLRTTYKTLVDEWGIRYIKLDFMEDSAVEGYHYKPNITALEAQRIGLTVIRRAVGEDVLLDKDGSPMLTPVGLVDTGRISVDTGHTFEATKEAGPAVAARYYMHRNFYLADADAFCVSRQTFHDAGWHRGQQPLTLDEARAAIALAAVSGGMYEIGDDLPTLAADPERMALVENRDLINMVRLGQASRPADLMTYLADDDQPSVYFLKEDRRQSILTVFNWTDKPRQHEFRFSELGLPVASPLQVLDVFEPERIISAENGSFKIEQGPHSSRVFKIVDLSVNPAKPAITVRVPQLAVVGEAIRMSVEAAPSGVPAVSYRWDFGDGTRMDGSEVVHAYTLAGNFVVKIVAEGIDGLSAEQNSDVTVSGGINIHFVPEQKRRMP